ncbi:MAG: 50S ribosomal protein L25 [Chloroflexi bacterium]|nr:50S ribosomal protein L25 [Chloroflexota bacterium]
MTLLKAGGTHLIDVDVDGAVQTVLARSVQRDVLKGTIIHVDFMAIDKMTKIATEVAVHLVGESPAVASRLGILQQDLMTVTIEALPADLVDALNVDISSLTDIGSVVHVSDLQLPSGVAVRNDADASVARVVALRAVVDETAAAEGEGGPAEPQLVERKRGDEFEE